MPTIKKSGSNTSARKGFKTCTCCHKEKRLSDFYSSYSPLFSIDNRVPVCKDCIKNMCTDKKTGNIIESELNNVLRSIDKPYYMDTLADAFIQVQKEQGNVSDSAVQKFGDKIIGAYFRNISMIQDRGKTYADSENDGFIHTGGRTSKNEKLRTISRFISVPTGFYESDIDGDEDEEEDSSIRWTKKDRQNMNYAISKIGYNPFDDVRLTDFDKKYCFNVLSGYFDTPGITEDGHKIQAVIEMTMLYCQCRKITSALNSELTAGNIDDSKVAKLTSSKTSLLNAIAVIAKENSISSKNSRDIKTGQDTISAKMKEMEENNYDDVKVNLFDIKTCESFKQIADLSNQSIMEQLNLDSNDYAEIIKEQRESIQKYEEEVDELREENRNLKNKIIDLENKG